MKSYIKRTYVKSCILVFTSLFLFNCGSKKVIMENSNFNYTEFRASQNTFQSKEGAIKYIDKGKGDVILLLHGVPTSSWLYRNMIDELVNEGYRIIAPDMLGFGNSDSPEGYEIYEPKEHTKRLLSLMDHLNINEWTHVMHDAGGLWTWELFKQAPKKVNKLVVLNTIIYEEGFKPPVRMNRGVFARFSVWLFENKLTSSTMVSKLFKDGLKHKELNENQLIGYKTPLREEKTNAMYQFFSNTCNDLPNYETVIKSIDIPVAVIWGKHDPFLKWKPQRKRVLSDLKVKSDNEHVIDAGHFIQEEEPQLVNKCILHFLKAN